MPAKGTTAKKAAAKRAPKLPKAPPVNPIEDGTEFNLDGTIDLRFAGQSHVLRPPLLGEYRDIKVLYTRGVAGSAEAMANLLSMQAELTAPDMTPEKANAIAERASALVQTDIDPIEHLVPLYDLIFTTLCDDPPNQDDYPIWLVENHETAFAIFQHWRTVPLGLGG